jgi:hypothetical protein
MPTLSIDVTAAQATRVAAALGKALGLVDANGAPRAATMAEAEAYVRDALRRVVLRQERRDAEQALTETPWG